jgi:tetratricopeptide (TPR) repeat protein
VYVTANQPSAKVALSAGDTVLLSERIDANPQACYEFRVELPTSADSAKLRGAVYDATGRELVSYAPREVDADVPDPATPIGSPEDLDSTDSLYFAGLHLEQYRHATRRPEDYYREALRLEPRDDRCHMAYGRLLYACGQYDHAEAHFRAAVGRAISHNPNPPTGECHYLLGLALAAQGKFDDADAQFQKSAWHTSHQDAAWFESARIAVRRHDWPAAEALLRRSLERNTRHHQAVHLLMIAVIEQHRSDEARQLATDDLERDPFNFGVLFELALSTTVGWDECDRRMRDDSHNYLTLASDYAAAGLTRRAVAALEHYLQRVADEPDTPLVYYCLADLHDAIGHVEEAARLSRLGAQMHRQGFFPNGREDLAALESAVSRLPDDFRAWCDLGNLLFANRRHDEAINAWECARDLARDFPQPRRNLGLAYFNRRGNIDAAWQSLEAAFELNSEDARVLYELDQLAKRLNHDPEERLERLHSHSGCVARRYDLSLEQVTLLNQLGRHEEAREQLLAHRFHPWEGGEGKVSGQYVLSLTELARRAIVEGKAYDALVWLRQALTWPHSLGEGKLASIRENNIHYWMGHAHRLRGEESTARVLFERASHGLAEPHSAQYYNDQPPEMIFYQGLALRALGREQEARLRFAKLVSYGQEHLDDDVAVDFFAVSLPEFLVFEADLAIKNELHCRFMLALGYLGLGDERLAEREFTDILRLDRSHLGAITHRGLCGAAMRSVI